MMDVIKARKKIRAFVKKNEGCSLNVLYESMRKDGIGRKRIKDIIFSDPSLKVVILPKKSKQCDLISLQKCNACGSTHLKEIYEVDLQGKKTLKAKKCKVCGFKMEQGKCKVYKYQIYEVKT